MTQQIRALWIEDVETAYLNQCQSARDVDIEALPRLVKNNGKTPERTTSYSRPGITLQKPALSYAWLVEVIIAADAVQTLSPEI